MEIESLREQLHCPHVEGSGEGSCRARPWPTQTRFEVMEASHTNCDIPRFILLT